MTDSKDFSLDNLKTILNTKTVGSDIHFFEKVASTFDMAKKLETKNGAVIIAKEQTDGKGRLGRSWESSKGGLYFSIILSAKYFLPHLQFATVVSALAVQRAMEKFLPCRIKWPNDIVSEDGKKLCGILTKAEFSNSEADYINIGIGINANNDDFSKELIYASSMKDIIHEKVDENRLLAEVFKNLELLISDDKTGIIKEFSRVCITVGSKVRAIYSDGNEIRGICTAVADDGSIIITKEDGKKVCVNSGEVSVRGIYGENYV